MTKAAIIRCEKNMDRCPMTNGFKCLTETKEGFAKYDNCDLAGVFTCRCPGDNIGNLAKILKSKGAEVIHLTTCILEKKTDNGWDASNGGFCENLNQITECVTKESGLSCILGTAHLPNEYIV